MDGSHKKSYRQPFVLYILKWDEHAPCVLEFIHAECKMFFYTRTISEVHMDLSPVAFYQRCPLCQVTCAYSFDSCNNSTVAHPGLITATDQKNPSYIIKSRYTSRWCWREDMPLGRGFWSTSRSCSCCSLWIGCFCALNVSSKVWCLRWAAGRWKRPWAGWSAWCWVWWGARGTARHLCHRESSHHRP